MSEHSFLKFFSCLFTVPAIKSCGKKMPEFWKKDFITNFHVMELYVDTLGLGACSLDSANVYMRGRTLCNHSNWQKMIRRFILFKRSYTKVCNHPQPFTTTRNHPQLPTTTHSYPQPLATTHNHPQLPTTTHIHNHPQPPKTTQKTIHNHPQSSIVTQKLPKKAKTFHKHLCYSTLDASTETDVDFDSNMKQWYTYMYLCMCVYTL